MNVEQYDHTGQLGKDANVLVMELKTGLQSKRIGDQCEAIAQFTNLVEKFPFPVVINSVFVMIADVFIEGSNFLRLCILKTCRECEQHLEKISCLEDVMPKIVSVIHSNDPVARSLTLRLFGMLSRVMSENKSLHYLVLMQLDSHYSVELNAALWSSHKFAAVSKSFASSLAPKVKSMLESLSTDTEWKLALIPLCRHLHHDVHILEEIRECLVGLLSAYQSTNFVKTVLKTLSCLTAKSPIHAHQQLNLLTSHLENEQRHSVLFSILNDFRTMSTHAPHIWTQEHIQSLCRFYQTHENEPKLQEQVLTVLCLIGESIAYNILDGDESKDEITVVRCTLHAVFSKESSLCSKGVRLLSALSQHAPLDVAENYALLMVTLFNSGWLSEEDSYHDAKSVFRYTAKIVEYHPSLVKITDHMNLFHFMEQGQVNHPDLVWDFLCQIASKVKLTNKIPSAFIIKLMKQPNTSGPIGSQLCTLLFQLWVGRVLPQDYQISILKFLEREASAWLAYCIGRSASRYGQHVLAAEIFENLDKLAVSEKFVFWLRGLSAMSKAEIFLSKCVSDRSLVDLLDSLRIAVDHLYQAKSSFACVSSRSLWFHAEYIRIRCKYLNALYELAVTASHAFNQENQSGNLQMLSHNLRSFEEVISETKQLSARSLDADDGTHLHLNALRSMTQVFTRTLNSLITSHVREKPEFLSSSRDSLMLNYLEILSNYSHKQLTEIIQPDGNSIDSKLVLETLVTLVDNATRIPFCLPRFFFQKLQTTDIRIVLLPKSSSQEYYPINLDVSHMLHVMGVLQQKSPLPKIPRKINRVIVKVYLESINPGDGQSGRTHTDNVVLYFTRNLPIQGDYFNCQFVMTPPHAGLYKVRVCVEPCDHTGEIWFSGQGHSETMLIRAEKIGAGPSTNVAGGSVITKPPQGPASVSIPSSTVSAVW